LRDLPWDAVERTQAASAIPGLRGLLMHALSEETRMFYESYGIVASPVGPITSLCSRYRLMSGAGRNNGLPPFE
jgi:hypothetical protein